MSSRTTQALLLAAIMLLSTGTAFGLGSKGDGMDGKKDGGMMQEEKSMETQGGSMQQEKPMMDKTKAMQDTKMMQQDDDMKKDGGMEQRGMEQKETMGTKDATPMR